jgi:nucleotide-binding universal stress UspA family protein
MLHHLPTTRREADIGTPADTADKTPAQLDAPADDRQPLAFARRPHPWLLVAVDGSPSKYGALVWALREAARREATVLAVTVADDHTHLPGSRPEPAALQEQLDRQIALATAETGVRGRVRTAVLDSLVFEALVGAARGADLVVVGTHGKTLLRPAVPRPPARRLARGA